MRFLRLQRRREAQDAHSAADGAKRSFLNTIRHELRTPLNAIIGFSEIMDAELLGPMPVPQYRDYVRDILASSRRLLQIIEDVLEISRAETGELVFTKREVNLQALILAARSLVTTQYGSREIAIEIDAADDLVVQVDPERLVRAITALLSNAVKFSPEGSEVRVAAGLDPEGVVAIAIEDRGIGMDPGQVEVAFAPFVQLDDTLARRFDGSGLGLPLARLLAELHGGSLEVDSEPGRGTTATLRVPAYAGMTTQAGRLDSLRLLG